MPIIFVLNLLTETVYYNILGREKRGTSNDLGLKQRIGVCVSECFQIKLQDDNPRGHRKITPCGQSGPSMIKNTNNAQFIVH